MTTSIDHVLLLHQQSMALRGAGHWPADPSLAPRDRPSLHLVTTDPPAARHQHSCIRIFWVKVPPTIHIACLGISTKCYANPSPEETTDGDAGTFGFALDDFDIHVEDGILHPTLANSYMIPTTDDRHSRVGQNLTGASLASLIKEEIPLNRNNEW